MNIDKLADKEFSELIERLLHHYKGKLPRDVISALFVSVINDSDRLAFCLERRIAKGRAELDKIIETNTS